MSTMTSDFATCARSGRVVIDEPKITQDGQSTVMKMCAGCGCQMPHKVGSRVCILCEMDEEEE